MAASKKKVSVVSDLPASKDAFGSHDRVAHAIVDLITTESGGRTIGVEGTWGSGKSTVVNIVRARLEASATRCVAIFDAWSHQGDPLRRSFLESLILVLSEKGWLTSVEKWHKHIEELARRHKTSTRTATPTLSGFGRLMGLALALFPLGIPIVTLSKDSAYTVALGSLFLVAPLAILALNGLFRRGNDIWALFIHRSVVEETTITAETPDPTSIEFGKYFDELMNDCLTVENRSLILVVDNLDRVSAEDAKAIWSVLRVFLDKAGHKPPKWHSKIWTIVPFDPAGIRAQFGNSNAQGENRGLTASNFLDKAVQIKFYVAPPLLSNWQEFLTSCLQQAFPEHNVQSLDFHRIYRLYAVAKATGGMTPTPRDLVTYVNAIGAMYRQWGDELPLAHMAYYEILRARGLNIASGLLDGSVPDAAALPLLGDSIRDDLAALHFNAPPTQARQVLLRGPISESLTAPDTSGLKSLAATHPGFPSALEHELQLLVSNWATSETQYLARAIHCVVTSAVLDSMPSSTKHDVIQTLELGLNKLEDWKLFNEETAQGIVSAIALTTNDAVVDSLISSVERTGSRGKEQGAKELAAWTRGCIAIAKALKTKGVARPDKPRFLIPCTPENWPSVCEVLWDSDPDRDSWPWIGPAKDWASILGALTKAATSDQYTNRHLRVIQVGTTTDSSVDWESVTGALEGRIVQSPGYDAEKILAAFRTLLVAEPHTQQKRHRLKQLADQGHLLSFLHLAWNTGVDEAIALLVLLHVREHPTGAAPGHVHHSQAGHANLTSLFAKPQSKPNVAKRFVELLIEENLIPLVTKMMESGGVHANWTKACLVELLERGVATTAFAPETLFAKWSYVRNTLDGGLKVGGLLDRVVAELVGDPKVVAHLVENQFEQEKGWLYAAIVRADVPNLSDFAEWCESGLRDIDKATWVQELSSHGDLAQLVIDLAAKGEAPSLGLPYHDALSDQCQSLVREGAKAVLLATNWDALKKPVQGYRIQTLKQSLLDRAKDAEGQIAQDFFDICAEDIGDPAMLKQDGRIVDSLFSKLVDVGHEGGIAWLAALFREHGNFLKDYSPAYRVEEFKERVSSALGKEGAEQIRSALGQIAAELGIKG